MGGRSSVEAWYPTTLDTEEVLAVKVSSDIDLFVADVIKSFDSVDRGILDRVLSSLGLPAWFRHACFEYHARVGLRFELAAGLDEPWTRDGGIPQRCPLSMMFIVALYLPWCRYLAPQEWVEPQLYADSLKCVSRDPGVLLRAARSTTGYVRLVGQEPAPSKCVLMSTSKTVRNDFRGWIVTDEGDKWSVKLDVVDLGGHLDFTFRGWPATLATRVRLVIARLVLIFVLPLDFHGRLRVIWSMFIPGVLHGIEASFIADTSLRMLRTAFFKVVWSSRQPLANVGAVLSLLDGPVVLLHSVLSGFGSVCFVDTLLTGLVRFLGCNGCWIASLRGAPVMALCICLLEVLLRLGFSGIPVSLGGSGLDCLY